MCLRGAKEACWCGQYAGMVCTSQTEIKFRSPWKFDSGSSRFIWPGASRCNLECICAQISSEGQLPCIHCICEGTPTSRTAAECCQDYWRNDSGQGQLYGLQACYWLFTGPPNSLSFILVFRTFDHYRPVSWQRCNHSSWPVSKVWKDAMEISRKFVSTAHCQTTNPVLERLVHYNERKGERHG